MASEPPQSDPFRVRLNWPEHDLVPATRREQQHDEPAEPAAHDDPDPLSAPDDVGDDRGGSVLFNIASRLEVLRASMQNVVVRLDSLTRRDEQFREFTTARFAEQAEQTAMSVSAARSDIEERARAHERALAEVMASLDTNGQVLSDLASLVEGLSTRLESVSARVEDLVGRSDSLAGRHEQVAAELRQELHPRLDTITAKVDDISNAALEGALDRLSQEMNDLAQRQQTEIEVVRAELVASVARTEARDEELSAEVARMAEEIKALRRRLPVAARRAAPAAEPAPSGRRSSANDDDDETEGEADQAFRPRRRPLRAPRE